MVEEEGDFETITVGRAVLKRDLDYKVENRYTDDVPLPTIPALTGPAHGYLISSTRTFGPPPIERASAVLGESSSVTYPLRHSEADVRLNTLQGPSAVCPLKVPNIPD
jgi:hypothetical protein